MKVREVIRLLEQNGWTEMRSKGSHRHFKRPDRPESNHGARKFRQRTRSRDAEFYTQKGGVEMKRYSIVIERTGTGYSAYSPDVDGCAAVGDSERETRQNFRDALEAHLEAMRDSGEPIPEPSSSVDYVEVAA